MDNENNIKVGDQIVSNHVGPDGESVDRLYGNPSQGGSIRLVQRDYSIYKGTITKKMIMVKGLDGDRFKSHVYVTADNRWFGRGGMPISKPTNLSNEPKETEETEKEEVEKSEE